MNNWIQVLGCDMGQKHLERCSELFVYMDMVYKLYKSHGGSAWWRYNEEFSRHFGPLGWGVKATDFWLCLMVSQKPSPFQLVATGSGPPAAQGSVAVRLRGRPDCSMKVIVNSSSSTSASKNAQLAEVPMQLFPPPVLMLKPLQSSLARVNQKWSGT